MMCVMNFQRQAVLHINVCSIVNISILRSSERCMHLIATADYFYCCCLQLFQEQGCNRSSGQAPAQKAVQTACCHGKA